MSLPAYPKYKDSGVEWLGEIPESWDVRRLKFAVSLINKKVDGKSSDVPYMGLEHVESWTGRRIPDGEAVCEGTASHFLPNDVLFGKLRPYLAKVYLSEIEGDASPELLVLRSGEKLHPPFLRYYMVSGDFIDAVDASTYGVKMPRANWDFIGNQTFLIPSVDEQETIADYLDKKTGQIDTLIEKKKELIERLKEQRTAIITHAVTKGLDDSVPMKDSGVEWLGEVPEHWEVRRIKFLTKILRGKFSHRPRNDPRFYDGEYPFVQTGDVAKAKKYIEKYTQTLNERGLSVSKQFPKGTLVMTIAANIGDMAVLNFDACFPDSIVGFVPDEISNLNYLYHLFCAMRPEFLKTAILNTQMNLNIERIENLSAARPPEDEQYEIAEYLEMKTGQIDGLIEKAAEAIQRLEEYRTAVITAAVTGRVNVGDG